MIPEDAVCLDLDTIDNADASRKLACVAIYARFLKVDNTYSCQLVFSRSKILPSNITQPRAELYAATVNSHTGEVVKRSFRHLHKCRVKLTDSQVVIYWINDKPVNQWVRNRVVEIQRFSKPEEWKYVQACDMIADLGTRPVKDLRLVSQESEWINGYSWIKRKQSDFPTKSIKEIKLTQNDIIELQKESPIKF